MSDTDKFDLKKVIAIIEPGAEKQPVLDRVTRLARGYDFDLKLIACDYSQYLVEGYYFSEAELPALRKEYLEERKVLLEALAEPLREGGISVETEAVWSYPSYKAIESIVDDYHPDLVIHHARRHAALSRVLLTNDDWQLVRHCKVPLLVVKEKPWKDDLVLVGAVDPMHARHKPSGLDHRILETGQSLVKQLGGALYAAHAYAPFPLSGIYPSDAKQEHQQALNALADEVGVSRPRCRFVEEAPEFALKAMEGELDVDLVVMGSISRSLLSDVFIGSTTEKVLDFLDCDALLLRPIDQ